MIRLENVTKSYSAEVVALVRRFDIPKGEFVSWSDRRVRQENVVTPSQPRGRPEVSRPGSRA